MKQLLKEIVKRITDNLLGKTNQSFDSGRRNNSNKNDVDTVERNSTFFCCSNEIHNFCLESTVHSIITL